MIDCTIYSADGRYVRALTVPDEMHVDLNRDDPSDVIVPGIHHEDTCLVDGQVCRNPPAIATQLMELRVERDLRLAASDWTQFPDSPLPAAARTEWRAYRQALRDLPAATEDPAAVDWPTPPTE